MKTAMRLIVMVSGIGSGLLRLIRACEQKELKAEIVAVGSDRHAPALSHASDYGIPFLYPHSKNIPIVTHGGESTKHRLGLQA